MSRINLVMMEAMFYVLDCPWLCCLLAQVEMLVVDEQVLLNFIDLVRKYSQLEAI